MQQRFTRFALVALAAVFAAALAAPVQAFETRARAAYVYDLTTDTVLLEKEADTPLPPASMSKLMTIEMLFDALADGRVALDTRFNVSSSAAAMARNEGSTMYLDERDRPTVEELLQGMIVLSGNDACVVVAEGLAGTEEAFANLMNQRAARLGLTASHFVNSSGWPAEGHVMSARDLGQLSVHLITRYPQFYGYFAETEFPFDGRAPANRFNRNPLLKLGLGADGLKTGHTSEAGYGLVGSATQGKRRIVFVLSGLDSEKARAEEAEAVINWAFRQFVQRTVAPAEQPLLQAPVWMGAKKQVGLVPAQDVTVLVPTAWRDSVPARVLFDSPLEAPLAKGEELATLVLELPGLAPRRVPLVAESDVAQGGVLTRLSTASGLLYRRYMGGTRAVDAAPPPAEVARPEPDTPPGAEAASASDAGAGAAEAAQ